MLLLYSIFIVSLLVVTICIICYKKNSKNRSKDTTVVKSPDTNTDHGIGTIVTNPNVIYNTTLQDPKQHINYKTKVPDQGDPPLYDEIGLRLMDESVYELDDIEGAVVPPVKDVSDGIGNVSMSNTSGPPVSTES